MVIQNMTENMTACDKFCLFYSSSLPRLIKLRKKILKFFPESVLSLNFDRMEMSQIFM